MNKSSYTNLWESRWSLNFRFGNPYAIFGATFRFMFRKLTVLTLLLAWFIRCLGFNLFVFNFLFTQICIIRCQCLWLNWYLLYFLTTSFTLLQCKRYFGLDNIVIGVLLLHLLPSWKLTRLTKIVFNRLQNRMKFLILLHIFCVCYAIISTFVNQFQLFGFVWKGYLSSSLIKILRNYFTSTGGNKERFIGFNPF